MILSLIVLQICSLLCSFMRKHQSVAMIDQKRIMDPVKKYLIKGFLHIPPILVCVSFALSNLDKSEETKIAKEKFPYLLPLLILPNVEMYSDSSIPIILTLIFMIFTFVLYCSLILYFYFQILYMLHGHRKFMAAKTYSKHISAMFSLVAQVSYFLSGFFSNSNVKTLQKTIVSPLIVRTPILRFEIRDLIVRPFTKTCTFIQERQNLLC